MRHCTDGHVGRVGAYLSVCARALFVLATCLWSLVGVTAEFGNPRFSPNEEFLAFDYCQPKCQFVVFSLKTGVAITFDAPKGESWINPSFGPKGDQVVFVVIRKASDTQLATIKLDGTGFRKLAASAVIKRSPSVSPDGKLVLFAGGSTIVNERGKASTVDLYVADFVRGEERRVTDLRIIDIGSPFFLPDGQKITFATVGSARPRSKLTAPSIPLGTMFPNRTVFVQSLNELSNLEPVLRVPLVASQPMPIDSGEIALLVRVYDVVPFAYDIFLAKDGRATRLTKFQSYVWSYGISNSGDLVAYVTDGPSKNWRENRLMLWRRSTGKAVELTIPPAKRIPLTNP